MMVPESPFMCVPTMPKSGAQQEEFAQIFDTNNRMLVFVVLCFTRIVSKAGVKQVCTWLGRTQSPLYVAVIPGTNIRRLSVECENCFCFLICILQVEKVENTNWVKLQVNARDSYAKRCVLPLKQFYLSEKFQPPIFAMPEVQCLHDKSKASSLSDLFEGVLQHPKKGPFVLAGEGKIGKSTLCRQLACHWAKNEPTGFDAIVYVPLSHKDALNVWKSVDRWKQIELQDWVTAYWKSSGYQFPFSLDEMFESLLKLKVLWLFDGFEDSKCQNIGSHGLLSHLRTLKIGSALITSCYSTAPTCSFGWKVLGLSDVAQNEGASEKVSIKIGA
jgi:hypothetical protein